MSYLFNVSGIIAEFNPFHNGHKYLLEKAKSESEAVVCVMSGSFVQRGEPAILPKHLRAKAAISCGADLVIELPAPWSLARARDFALGGVFLLKNCLINTLVFGSECGDNELLLRAAKTEKNDMFKELLKRELEKGITYAAARQNAVSSIDSDAASVLSQPNNILATEYISAAQSLNFSPRFVTVKRVGSSHDSAQTENEYASASFLRENFEQKVMQGFTPDETIPLYKKAVKNGEICDYSRFSTVSTSIIRFKEKLDFENLADISEGLDFTLYKASRSGADFDGMCNNAKSKRYTLARIRRLFCLAALGIDKNVQEGLPPYIRVLGMTDKGAELLGHISKSSSLPIIARPADAKKLDGYAKKVFDSELTASDMQAFCFKNPQPCGYELIKKIVKG